MLNSPLFVYSARLRSARLIASITVALIAVGCSGDRSVTAPVTGSRSLSVSFSSIGVAPAASGQVGALPQPGGNVLTPANTIAERSLLAVSGADTLIITKAQLVLSRVELTQSTGTPCDDDSALAGCTELERHFVLIDLPTDTAVHTVIDAGVPPGTYSSLEARLRVPRSTDDSRAAAFLAAHPEFASANVRVEGTFRGLPFTYLGSVDTRFELTFVPPITVALGGVNVTIHVDATSWFRDRSGALIDPSTANASGGNASLVSNNIRRSFRAVRDDERDGRDHGGEHDRGDDGHGGPGHG